MQDLNEILAEMENKAARLAIQAEQEKAMAEVLPQRFANNISALKKHIPDVAKILNLISQSGIFVFFVMKMAFQTLSG